MEHAKERTRRATSNVEQGWFSMTDAAAYLGTTPKTAYELLRGGFLKPFYRKGSKRKFYRRSDLDALHEPAPGTRWEIPPMK